MKKLTLGFMLFALAAATMFSSCKKDKDNDEVHYLSATLNGEKFSTSAASFYGSKSSESGTSKLGEIFSSEEGTTTIAGTANGKQLCITLKGTQSGSYDLSVSANNVVTNALINLLSGKTAEESIKDAVDVTTEAMIIYRATGQTEGGSDYWFSTEAHVDFQILAVYSQGTFSATMQNKAGDKFTFSDGSFKLFGKPAGM
ncbi:MAG: hypothetical protein J5826_05165 [Bacteroidales bacterium]|nr:hypothetical protein [Bacteroidales bacterium]